MFFVLSSYVHVFLCVCSPQTYTIGPNDQRTIKANIKVSSTETGHIFGTIVYDSAAGEDDEPNQPREKVVVNLNDIHLVRSRATEIKRMH